MATVVETTFPGQRSAVRPAVRMLRLRYNSIFLPEYISTVVLSVLISWFFLVNVNPAVAGWGSRVHALFALALYAALATGLLWLTCLYRIWYSDVILAECPDGETLIRVGRRWFPLRGVNWVEERIGTFFGRTIRELSARDDLGTTFEVNECMLGYDSLKQVFRQLCGIEVFTKAGAARDELETVRWRWQRRQQVLAQAAGAVEAGGRFGFRILCLFPVAVVDIAINAVLSILLQHLGQGELVVYVAPLSLAVSAVIARFVYYYLFTSVILNMQIG